MQTGRSPRGRPSLKTSIPHNSVTVRRIRRVLWFLKAIGFDDDARRLLDWLDVETANGQFPRTVVAAWRKRIGPVSD